MPEPASTFDFGALVRALRRRRLLSQEDLAIRATLSVRTIRHLETGQVQQPRPGTVQLLADALALVGAERSDFELASVGQVADQEVERPSQVDVPAQLPADIPDFTGRGAELEILEEIVDGRVGSGPAVCAVTGTAGAGKTALVLHWAHQTAERFPDGQLFVDLRGCSSEVLLDPGEALGRFLRALGVPPSAVPLDTDERAALYRTRLAGRRVLVVLDNAGSADQVRSLLPGVPTCVAIVTGRGTLGGLVAREGARRLELELLTPGESQDLLTGLIGARARAEPAAIETLAEQCARLPLALRVAANLVAEHPRATIRELTADLADEERRLVLLDAGGDPGTAVGTVLSWSYERLSPGTARAFRLLSLTAGADIDDATVAALTASTMAAAASALRELDQSHLVREVEPGRYGMHELLHAYATGLSARTDTAAERAAALRRLSDHRVAASPVAS